MYPHMDIFFGCSKLLLFSRPRKTQTPKPKTEQKHLHHGRTVSLSFPPCLSQTKTDLKPPPIGASRGHTALVNRRGSSLLQRYVAQNPQPNTSLKKYRWCMHHSPPALCSNIPPKLAALLLSAARIWILDAAGGGYLRRTATNWPCLALATTFTCYCNLWVPKKLMSTQQYSTNIPKMIQQSKRVGGGANSRKSNGGGGCICIQRLIWQWRIQQAHLCQPWCLTSSQQHSTINAI